MFCQLLVVLFACGAHRPARNSAGMSFNADGGRTPPLREARTEQSALLIARSSFLIVIDRFLLSHHSTCLIDPSLVFQALS
jgi:hypothetical protein